MRRARYEVQNDNRPGLSVLPGEASPWFCLPCTMQASGPAPPSGGQGLLFGLSRDSGSLSLGQSNLCFGKFLIFLFSLVDVPGRKCFQKVPLEFSHVKEFIIVE
jgi:hypothetical protein